MHGRAAGLLREIPEANESGPSAGVVQQETYVLVNAGRGRASKNDTKQSSILV